jgi:hypothetical protein
VHLLGNQGRKHAAPSETEFTMLLQARHCHFKEHAVCRTVLFVPVQAVHNVKKKQD